MRAISHWILAASAALAWTSACSDSPESELDDELGGRGGSRTTPFENAGGASGGEPAKELAGGGAGASSDSGAAGEDVNLGGAGGSAPSFGGTATGGQTSLEELGGAAGAAGAESVETSDRPSCKGLIPFVVAGDIVEAYRARTENDCRVGRVKYPDPPGTQFDYANQVTYWTAWILECPSSAKNTDYALAYYADQLTQADADLLNEHYLAALDEVLHLTPAQEQYMQVFLSRQASFAVVNPSTTEYSLTQEPCPPPTDTGAGGAGGDTGSGGSPSETGGAPSFDGGSGGSL